MVRESGISATKPIFPSYLLPSFRLPFIHRRQSSASSHATASSLSDGDDQGASSPSTTFTTPNNSPPKHDTVGKAGTNHQNRLSRTEPDTLRCGTCSTDLAFAAQIVSKGFTGRHGRAFLVAPQSRHQSLLNMRIGRNENRQLVTGWHVVADISCGTCSTKLGWKYVDAKEPSQKYKIGKFILETERVVTYRSWEYADERTPGLEEEVAWQQQEVAKERQSGDRREDSDDEVSFDSEDDEECEDIFAGTWDAETVAKRRRSLGMRRKSTAQ